MQKEPSGARALHTQCLGNAAPMQSVCYTQCMYMHMHMCMHMHMHMHCICTAYSILSA